MKTFDRDHPHQSHATPATEIDTRLTATPVFDPNGNSPTGFGAGEQTANGVADQPEVFEGQALATSDDAGEGDGEFAPDGGAGYRETAKPGNQAQVVVPQGAEVEIQLMLGQLGVNLAETRLGRKHVFDDFLRGRLVSLLAMGLSLRQAASALGVSHVAIFKELKRNPELNDQVQTARFQAQIEPLLVVLRESKRSWRAATWVVNYLQKQIAKRDETPDEAKARCQEDLDQWKQRNKEEVDRMKQEAYNRWVSPVPPEFVSKRKPRKKKEDGKE